MNDYYDTAKICINGHVITDSLQIDTQIDQKFCDKCGSSLITKCPNCNANIRGKKHIRDVTSITNSRVFPLTKPDKFCYNCGKPYPWLESKIKAAQELAHEIENLSEEEINILTDSINDIVVDTPKTQVSASRFIKILSKTGKGVINAFRDLLIDVASETAKKIIWPK